MILLARKSDLAHFLSAMCGIAGFVSAAGVNKEAVAKMTARLGHRGPDESGSWSGECCALGHCRLRIIDLSASGSQPMIDDNSRFVLVFNGEIFNFRLLREKLRQNGLSFRGTSDTEVILKGFQHWGEKLPEKLHGMFAFAIWDTERKRLFAARDRYGKKPFFYHQTADGLYFASEVEALLSGLDPKPPVSPEGFASYIRFGYVPGTESTYEGIRRLGPAHTLVWEGGLTRVAPYQAWPPHAAQQRTRTQRDESELLAELGEILRSAVRDRLVSDVPLGCWLSGGIDSSLIVALARDEVGPELKTFNVSFPGTHRDESAEASVIARALNTRHARLELSESEMEDSYLSTLRMATEPIGDDSFIPTYLISKLTRDHVTVALSGDGGDELFGGYPKYGQINTAARFFSLASLVPEVVDTCLPDKAAKALGLFRSRRPVDRALWLSSLWKEAKLHRVLEDPRAAEAGRRFYEDEWNRCKGECLHEQFALVDLVTYLEGDILTKVDRASMAASLEVRSPFLDHRVIDFVSFYGLLCTDLCRNKLALRKLLAKRLNPRLFEAPKKGFGLPIDEWLRGGLRPVLEEYTSSARLRAEGLLDADYIAWVRSEHLSGRRNYGRKLHAVIAWEVWAEKMANK